VTGAAGRARSLPLVLDVVHVLMAPASQQVLAGLLDPPLGGLRVILTARTELPALRLAGLRARGRSPGSTCR
jgi:hypothetical protein